MPLDTETIWKILGIVFAAGAFWQELRAIRKDIARLEEKQDKYNNLQIRGAKLEARFEGERKRT